MQRMITAARKVEPPPLEIVATGAMYFDEFAVRDIDANALGRFLPSGTRRRLLDARDVSFYVMTRLPQM